MFWNVRWNKKLYVKIGLGSFAVWEIRIGGSQYIIQQKWYIYISYLNKFIMIYINEYYDINESIVKKWYTTKKQNVRDDHNNIFSYIYSGYVSSIE